MPAVAQHPSNVPNRLRSLRLAVIALIDRLTNDLDLAFVLRYRESRFPQRPRPRPSLNSAITPNERTTKTQELATGDDAYTGFLDDCCFLQYSKAHLFIG